MKNDKLNMITTFKVFETVSTEDSKKSYLMTLSEYKEKVSPVLKNFRKFLSKNTDYLKSAGYYGVQQLTWDEYEEEEKKSLVKQYPDSWNSWGKKMVEERWPNHKPAPKEVLNTYNEYVETLTQLFGKYVDKIDDDETNSNKRSVRRALDDGLYVELIKDGKLTYEKFEEIIVSAGLKVPVGFNKKVNHRPKVEGKTTEEKAFILKRIKNILDSFVTKKLDAWSITPRMTRNMYRISYSDVSMFKYIVDSWNFLDPEQQSQLEEVEDYKRYISRAKEYIIKAGEKDVNFADDSVYKKIIEDVKIKIQPTIDEHKLEIKEKTLDQQKLIKQKKSELSEDEFIKRYGDEITDRQGRFVRFDMSKFENSVTGRLLVWNKDKTDMYIKTQQDMYQENEHNKLNLLFYRLKTKYPNIIEFKFSGTVVSKRTGIEFNITGYDKEGVIYDINTNTIFAGGYNIQVYHMRWLMSVSVDGKKVASFSSEKQ